MNNVLKNIIFHSNKIKFILLFFLVFFSNNLIYSYAENLDIRFNYGINNVAKKGLELPAHITIENNDSQDFVGTINLNIYENNNSVYIYKDKLNIGANSSQILNFDISLSNSLNTITIDVLNRREEIVSTERTNIDLSYYDYKLIIGIITSDFNKYSYVDNILIDDTSIETKIVEINPNIFDNNSKLLDIIDMLIITDYNYNNFSNNKINNLRIFAESGKPIFISRYGNIRNNRLPDFIEENYDSVRQIEIGTDSYNLDFLASNDMNIFVAPYSLTISPNQSENVNFIHDFLNNLFVKNIIERYTNAYQNTIQNDYYNIGNLLNIVDKEKLPDIFMLSILIITYVLILIVGIYVLLRNINKRMLYAKCALAFSLITFIILLIILFPINEKSSNLTYISVVDINNNNTKEKAFLNFRINDRKNLSFSVNNNLSLYPLLKTTNEPIRSFNFIDFNNIKKTTFEDNNGRLNVSVENASSLDPSIFIYENSNYLNDVYNIDCSYERFDGNITGRITNNMGIRIRDAHILLQGKILNIGDIEPNYSISLSRARVYNAPIGNNEMLADMLADNFNHNIIKYYLDENIKGNFDYAYFFGFIDNNGTLDINSNDVGNIYGKTLIATKIFDSKVEGINDLSGLSNRVENVLGFYDENNNSIKGDETVINTYSFTKDALISKIYIESIESYDYGKLESNVPFYGSIEVYNNITNNFDTLNENTIQYDELNKYLSSDNKLTIRFSPMSRDPLYRLISLPIPRAIAAN